MPSARAPAVLAASVSGSRSEADEEDGVRAARRDIDVFQSRRKSFPQERQAGKACLMRIEVNEGAAKAFLFREHDTLPHPLSA